MVVRAIFFDLDDTLCDTIGTRAQRARSTRRSACSITRRVSGSSRSSSAVRRSAARVPGAAPSPRAWRTRSAWRTTRRVTSQSRAYASRCACSAAAPWRRARRWIRWSWRRALRVRVRNASRTPANA